jgi:hypothetical protein
MKHTKENPAGGGTPGGAGNELSGSSPNNTSPGAAEQLTAAATLPAWVFDGCAAAAEAKRARAEAFAEPVRKVARALGAVRMPEQSGKWLLACPPCGQETIIDEVERNGGSDHVCALARSLNNCPSTDKIRQLVLRELRRAGMVPS